MSKIDVAKRSAAAGMAAVLLYTAVAVPCAEANLWQERRAAARALRAETGTGTSVAQIARLPQSRPILPDLTRLSGSLAGAPARPAILPRRYSEAELRDVPQALLRLPLSCGELKSIHIAKPGAPLIVLIQDAHEIESAQRNIAQILSALSPSSDSDPALLVGLEGATGAFDLSRFRGLRNREALRLASDFLLANSFISGAEFFALTAQSEPVLWGLENESLYLANVEAYRSGRALAQDARGLIEEAESALQEAKDKSFSPRLQALDRACAQFAGGSIPLAEYLELLAEGRGAAGFPQVERLLDISRMEKHLDFAKVEAQRASVVAEVSRRLKPADLEDLLRQSLAYRLGRIGHSDFYAYLEGALAAARIDVRAYPEFNAYVRYAILAGGIDAGEALRQTDRFRKAVLSTLARTGEQRRLVSASDGLRLIGKLTRYELSPQEWDAYRSWTSDSRPGRDAGTLLSAPWKKLNRILPEFEKFYTAAAARNAALVDGIEGKVRPSSCAAMVVGGFHAPAMEKELARRGLSYATVMPKVGRVGSATRYLEVLSGNRTPIEKMVLGEKLLVNPPVSLAAGIYGGFEHLRQVAFNTLALAYIAFSRILDAAAESAAAETSTWMGGPTYVEDLGEGSERQGRMAVTLTAEGGAKNRFLVVVSKLVEPWMAGGKAHESTVETLRGRTEGTRLERQVANYMLTIMKSKRTRLETMAAAVPFSWPMAAALVSAVAIPLTGFLPLPEGADPSAVKLAWLGIFSASLFLALLSKMTPMRPKAARAGVAPASPQVPIDASLFLSLGKGGSADASNSESGIAERIPHVLELAGNLYGKDMKHWHLTRMRAVLESFAAEKTEFWMAEVGLNAILDEVFKGDSRSNESLANYLLEELWSPGTGLPYEIVAARYALYKGLFALWGYEMEYHDDWPDHIHPLQSAIDAPDLHRHFKEEMDALARRENEVGRDLAALAKIIASAEASDERFNAVYAQAESQINDMVALVAGLFQEVDGINLEIRAAFLGSALDILRLASEHIDATVQAIVGVSDHFEAEQFTGWLASLTEQYEDRLQVIAGRGPTASAADGGEAVAEAAFGFLQRVLALEREALAAAAVEKDAGTAQGAVEPLVRLLLAPLPSDLSAAGRLREQLEPEILQLLERSRGLHEDGIGFYWRVEWLREVRRVLNDVLPPAIDVVADMAAVRWGESDIPEVKAVLSEVLPVSVDTIVELMAGRWDRDDIPAVKSAINGAFLQSIPIILQRVSGRWQEDAVERFRRVLEGAASLSVDIFVDGLAEQWRGDDVRAVKHALNRGLPASIDAIVDRIAVRWQEDSIQNVASNALREVRALRRSIDDEIVVSLSRARDPALQDTNIEADAGAAGAEYQPQPPAPAAGETYESLQRSLRSFLRSESPDLGLLDPEAQEALQVFLSAVPAQGKNAYEALVPILAIGSFAYKGAGTKHAASLLSYRLLGLLNPQTASEIFPQLDPWILLADAGESGHPFEGAGGWFRGWGALRGIGAGMAANLLISFLFLAASWGAEGVLEHWRAMLVLGAAGGLFSLAGFGALYRSYGNERVAFRLASRDRRGARAEAAARGFADPDRVYSLFGSRVWVHPQFFVHGDRPIWERPFLIAADGWVLVHELFPAGPGWAREFPGMAGMVGLSQAAFFPWLLFVSSALTMEIAVGAVILIAAGAAGKAAVRTGYDAVSRLISALVPLVLAASWVAQIGFLPWDSDGNVWGPLIHLLLGGALALLASHLTRSFFRKRQGPQTPAEPAQVVASPAAFQMFAAQGYNPADLGSLNWARRAYQDMIQDGAFTESMLSNVQEVLTRMEGLGYTHYEAFYYATDLGALGDIVKDGGIVSTEAPYENRFSQPFVQDADFSPEYQFARGPIRIALEARVNLQRVSQSQPVRFQFASAGKGASKWFAFNAGKGMVLSPSQGLFHERMRVIVEKTTDLPTVVKAVEDMKERLSQLGIQLEVVAQQSLNEELKTLSRLQDLDIHMQERQKLRDDFKAVVATMRLDDEIKEHILATFFHLLLSDWNLGPELKSQEGGLLGLAAYFSGRIRSASEERAPTDQIQFRLVRNDSGLTYTVPDTFSGRTSQFKGLMDRALRLLAGAAFPDFRPVVIISRGMSPVFGGRPGDEYEKFVLMHNKGRELWVTVDDLDRFPSLLPVVLESHVPINAKVRETSGLRELATIVQDVAVILHRDGETRARINAELEKAVGVREHDPVSAFYSLLDGASNFGVDDTFWWKAVKFVKDFYPQHIIELNGLAQAEGLTGIKKRVYAFLDEVFEDPAQRPAPPLESGISGLIARLFPDLSDEDKIWLAGRMTVREAEAGEVVIRKGERLSAAYFILSGELETLREGAAPLRLGSRTVPLLAGMALVTDVEAAADVTALTPVTLLRLDRRSLSSRSQARVQIVARAARYIVRTIEAGYPEDRPVETTDLSALAAEGETTMAELERLLPPGHDFTLSPSGSRYRVVSYLGMTPLQVRLNAVPGIIAVSTEDADAKIFVRFRLDPLGHIISLEVVRNWSTFGLFFTSLMTGIVGFSLWSIGASGADWLNFLGLGIMAYAGVQWVRNALRRQGADGAAVREPLPAWKQLAMEADRASRADLHAVVPGMLQRAAGFAPADRLNVIDELIFSMRLESYWWGAAERLNAVLSQLEDLRPTADEISRARIGILAQKVGDMQEVARLADQFAWMFPTALDDPNLETARLVAYAKGSGYRVLDDEGKEYVPLNEEADGGAKSVKVSLKHLSLARPGRYLLGMDRFVWLVQERRSGGGERGELDRIEQGDVSHVFFQDGASQVSAHLRLDRRRADRALIEASLPHGNGGALLAVHIPDGGAPSLDAVNLQAVRDGDSFRPFLGVRFSVSAPHSSLLFGPVAAGNMRDIRDFASALDAADAGAGFPERSDEPALRRLEVGSELRVQSSVQEGDHRYRLILSFPPGVSIQREGPFWRATSDDGGGLSWTVEVANDFMPLPLLRIGQIIVPPVLDRLLAKTAEYLIHPGAWLAGSSQFLTPFARDAMMTMRMFLAAETATDRTILVRSTLLDGLESVLNEVSTDGEVPHEVDFRHRRGSPHRLDFGMVDVSFMLPGLVRDLSKGEGREDVSRLFSQHNARGETHALSLLRNMDWALRQALPYSGSIRRPQADPAQAFRGLVHLKEGRLNGNWSDSGDGLARAFYPYDVNAVWVPDALHAVSALLLDPSSPLRPLLLQELEREDPGRMGGLRAVLREPAALRDAIEDWNDVGRRWFRVRLPLNEWRSRLKRFYDWLKGHDAGRRSVWLASEIGTDASGGVVTAEEFIYSDTVPTWAEADGFGLTYFGRGLDKSGTLIAAPNTDPAFRLLAAGMPTSPEEAEDLVQILQVPESLGGLESPIGLIVANPMLADPVVADPVLQTGEKEDGFGPTWSLALNEEYHWSVVWNWVVVAAIVGLGRYGRAARDRADPPAHLQRVRQAIERLWTSGIPHALRNQEVVSRRSVDGTFEPVPLGSAAEGPSAAHVSNPYQLWNVALIAAEAVVASFREKMEDRRRTRVSAALSALAAFAVAVSVMLPFPGAAAAWSPLRDSVSASIDRRLSVEPTRSADTAVSMDAGRGLIPLVDPAHIGAFSVRDPRESLRSARAASNLPFLTAIAWGEPEEGVRSGRTEALQALSAVKEGSLKLEGKEEAERYARAYAAFAELAGETAAVYASAAPQDLDFARRASRLAAMIGAARRDAPGLRAAAGPLVLELESVYEDLTSRRFTAEQSAALSGLMGGTQESGSLASLQDIGFHLADARDGSRDVLLKASRISAHPQSAALTFLLINGSEEDWQAQMRVSGLPQEDMESLSLAVSAGRVRLLTFQDLLGMGAVGEDGRVDVGLLALTSRPGATAVNFPIFISTERPDALNMEGLENFVRFILWAGSRVALVLESREYQLLLEVQRVLSVQA